MTQFLVIGFVWVIASFLIGSIMRGEARFRDLFIGSCYCLTPFILIGLPLTALSNVMSLNESAIYDFLYNGMLVWTALMFFWMVQSLQNYELGATALTIVATLCTMLIFGVLAAISLGLTKEMTQFLYSIYVEVRLR